MENVLFSIPIYGSHRTIIKAKTSHGSVESIRHITNLHFSSSAVGKFIVYKNGETLATLFTSRTNLNADYLHSIEVYGVDEIEVEMKNVDRLPADMYVGWDLK